MNNSAWACNRGELKSNIAGKAMLLMILLCYRCAMPTLAFPISWKCAYSFTFVQGCMHVSLWLMLLRRSITTINSLNSPTQPEYLAGVHNLMLTAVSVLFTWKQGIAIVMTGWIPGVYECLLVPGPLEVTLRSGEGGGCAMATWL